MPISLKNLVFSRRTYRIFIITVRVITVLQIVCLPLLLFGQKESLGIAFEYAAYNDDPKYLADNLPFFGGVDCTDDQGITLLMWASMHGKRRNVAYLLEHGADKAKRSEDGKTAYDHTLEAMLKGTDHSKVSLETKVSLENYKQVLDLVKT